MKNRKTMTLTLIGLFIFLFSIVGLTYAYWSRTLIQTGENLVYTDCLKLEVNWGTEGFTLNDAYPMTNKELLSDFFPKQMPYHFTITNTCESEVPISINMESLTPTEDTVLKDEYVDIILWEDESTDYFNQGSDTVLSSVGSRMEFDSEDSVPSYKLTDNKVNDDKILTEANKAYQLHTFKLGASQTKKFSLLLFMDYATPVSTEEEQTNNAHWRGKITLNNYEIPKVKIAGIDVELVTEGNGLYKVEHPEEEINDMDPNWQQTEYRYAGTNYDANQNSTNYVHNYVTFNGESWRIIGLVNVKTIDEDIVQRLKIIKNDRIGNIAWDNNYVNDWTKSSLMDYLNQNYYNNNPIEETSTSALTDELSKSMIDENIIWNLGGKTGNEEDSSNNLVTDWYQYERGENVYLDSQPVWQKDESKIAKIGLIYPSDYGWSTNGGNKGREECLKTGLYDWNTELDCANNAWLKPDNGYSWTLTPNAANSNLVFHISSTGYVHLKGGLVSDPNRVYPTLYLKKEVRITSGTGAQTDPFQLSIE